jgi:hypothetical protein
MNTSLPISLIPDTFSTPPRRRKVCDDISEKSESDSTEKKEYEADEVDRPMDQEKTPHVECKVVDLPEHSKMNSEANEILEDTEEDVVVTLDVKSLEQGLSLRELKQRCSDMGLNTTGKKSDLVSRLAANKE